MFNSLHLSEVLMLWLIGVYISSVLTLDNLAWRSSNVTSLTWHDLQERWNFEVSFDTYVRAPYAFYTLDYASMTTPEYDHVVQV